MADKEGSDLLDWAPFAGGVAIAASIAAKDNSLARMKAAWEQGRSVTNAMRAYTDMISRQSIKGGLTLPSDLGRDMETYILRLARHTTGTTERLQGVRTFQEVLAMKERVPEFYEAVLRHTNALRGISLDSILQGAQLGVIPDSSAFLQTRVMGRRTLPALLRGISHRRHGGNFANEFLELQREYERAYNVTSVVTATKRQTKMASGRMAAHTISLNLSGGRTAIEIPVMTHNREFISRTGTVNMAGFFETGAEELAPDIYMIRKMKGAIQAGLPIEGAQNIIDKIYSDVMDKAIFTERLEANPTSPLAKMFLGARARVEGETPQEIFFNRVARAKEWSSAGSPIRDRTSMMPASDKGLIYSRDFRPEEWTQVGVIPDDKYYKTFSKNMPLARESLEHRAKMLATGGDRVAHLLTPASVGKGYYEAASQTGETLANLNIGFIHKEHVKDLEKKFMRHTAEGDRRMWLSMAKGDEIIMSSEMKDLWKAERQMTYTINEAGGVGAELLAAHASGEELAAGTYLGVDPTGSPIYSGERGGREFVTGIERREGKILAFVRNVVTPEEGTKVVGTSRIKHTLRQFVNAKTQQSLFSYYLQNFKNIPEEEADRLARSINAIAISEHQDIAGQAFKNPEQYAEQLLSELAAAQVRAKRAGAPGYAEAEAGAELLKGFGYKLGNEKVARWYRADYSMRAEDIVSRFEAAQPAASKTFWPGGITELVEAQKGDLMARTVRNVQLIGHELIRHGPTIEDLGVGRLATFSHEMTESMFDLGHGTAAMDVLSRVEGSHGDTLRGLAKMMEPFKGGVKKGTHIQDLTVAQKIASSEHFVGDWLAHRSSHFPEGGVIHFGKSYTLSGGAKISYLQMPTDTLMSLKGVTLEDGRNAGSELQYKLQQAIRAVEIDLAQPANAAGDTYWAAKEALQNYYDMLAKLVGGKKGAVRGVLGGKVKGSMILQAASLPRYFPGQGMIEKETGEVLPDVLDYAYVTNEAMEEMLGSLTPTQHQALFESMVEKGEEFGNVMEAFRAGKGVPSMSLRYPAESALNALPMKIRSAEWGLRQAEAEYGNLARFQLSNKLMYIHPAVFAMQLGDYDADTIHAILMSTKEGAEHVKGQMAEGLLRDYTTHYEEMLKTAGVKEVQPGVYSHMFTNSQERILSRIAQQQAGKADIGMVSNTLSQVRQAAKAIPKTGVNAGVGAVATDWTALISEAAFIKAKHSKNVEDFYRNYNPEELINTLKGRGLNRTIGERTSYIIENYIKEVINPADYEGDARIKAETALERHTANIRASLERYDKYQGGPLQRMFGTMKATADRITGGRASALLNRMGISTDFASVFTSHQLDKLGHFDKGGWRSRLQANLAAPLSALSEMGALSRKQKAWLGGGLAASVALTLLKPAKTITPEKVTGSELQREGVLSRPPQMQFTPSGRLAPMGNNLQTSIRGKIPPNMSPAQLGNAVNSVTGNNTRVNVSDNRKRITREDFRRMRR